MGNTIYIPESTLDTTMALNLSNNLVVNTDDLVVDTVNSKVGIGTSTPAYTLDVHGTANVGALTATSISGPLSGNADTATALQTGRTINGVSFNGTGNITITANTHNTLTRGSYLTGSNFNGSAATTWAVDATDANTVSKVVARDGSGNFSAGTITATLSGVASSITNQANSATITASASAGNNTIVQRNSFGYIYANYFNTSPNDVSSDVSKVCVETNNDGFIRHGTSAAISTFLGLENSATTTSTSTNTVNAIVKRDASGDFSAGTITATLSGTAAVAASTNGNGKIVVQNSTDGGNTRGIWLWNSGDSNWGIYMGQSGASRSLSGGTAVAGNGFSTHAVRFRASNNVNNGFIWENSSESALLTLRSSDGWLAHTGNMYNSGTLESDGRIYADNGCHVRGDWLRVDGTNGIHFDSYGGGWFMQDTTYVRAYSNKTIYTGGDILAGGNVTAYSDIRHKKDLTKINNALEKVEKLSGYTYTRIDNEKRYTGVVAQEVLDVLPEAVNEETDGHYSVAYGNMVGLLIEAIKELKLEIDELKKSK